MQIIFIPSGPGKVFTPAIAKGGPGKTTTAINWGAGLALTFLQQKLLLLGFSAEAVLSISNSFLFGPGVNASMVQEIIDGYLRLRGVDQGTRKAVFEKTSIQTTVALLVQEPGKESVVDLDALHDFLFSDFQDAQLVDLLRETIVITIAVLRNEVLFCEMDPQRNMSQGMGITLQPGQKTMHDVLVNPMFGVEYAVVTTRYGIDMIPATSVMSELEVSLIAKQELSFRREHRLNDALRNATGGEGYPIKQQAVERYSVIIIDPPPSLGQLMLNATVPVDGILAVLDMGYYSWNSMSELEARIQLVRQVNTGIDIAGVVCNRYDSRPGFVDICVAVEEMARQQYPGKVLGSRIPYNSSIMKAPAGGVPVQFFKPESGPTKTASTAYANLAQETIPSFNIRSFQLWQQTSTPQISR
jgi:chromosome partitioning protein